jgi:hypothetical protein
MTKRAGRRWQGHRAAKRLHSLAAGCADALIQHELLSPLKMLASASVSNASFSNTASTSIADASSASVPNAASTSIADASSASLSNTSSTSIADAWSASILNSASVSNTSVELPTPAPPTVLASAAEADAANAAAAADLHMPAPPAVLASAVNADAANADAAASSPKLPPAHSTRLTQALIPHATANSNNTIADYVFTCEFGFGRGHVALEPNQRWLLCDCVHVVWQSDAEAGRRRTWRVSTAKCASMISSRRDEEHHLSKHVFCEPSHSSAICSSARVCCGCSRVTQDAEGIPPRVWKHFGKQLPNPPECRWS